jgi:Uma2 family endonuclease
MVANQFSKGKPKMLNTSIQMAIHQVNPSNYLPSMAGSLAKSFGAFHALPVPSMERQAISLNIAAALLQHAEAGNLGRVLQAPCGIVISKRLIQPDVLFVARERRGIIGEANLHAAPDLIVEVLSPGMQERDRRAKRKLYAFLEVREYWIVDPEAATIEVLVWSELGYALAGVYGRSDLLLSPLLPKLRLSLSDVFPTEDE